uniref:Glycosyl transferase family 25 domain-containing protein n=1 Tax=Zooxanthella nutricula TaxID=1333877 RepID=A0A7S2IZV6_9DINO|mmetsp:Transcript_23720/g.71256  ORF Transcript_23720/g.71256 Transcript_23720/m.71256 type:complete len:264 (+) Transcript_23720:64-855(+)
MAPKAAMGVKRTVAKRKAVLRAPKVLAPKGGKASTKVPKPAQGIRAVAINLARRPDRWDKVSRSVGKQAPWLHLERLDAVDGRAAPPPVKDVTKKWSTGRLADLFFWYKRVTVAMSAGERGCCGSHISAWRMAAKGKRPLVVVEDDAVALPTFSSSLVQALKEAPPDTGMIFLSSKDRGTPKAVGKVLMEPSFVWTTVGYVIWPAAAKTLLRMLPLDMPVDNFLAWHIKQGKIRAFSMRPAGVRQANTWNVGSDVPHSDDVAH